MNNTQTKIDKEINLLEAKVEALFKENGINFNGEISIKGMKRPVIAVNGSYLPKEQEDNFYFFNSISEINPKQQRKVNALQDVILIVNNWDKIIELHHKALEIVKPVYDKYL